MKKQLLFLILSGILFVPALAQDNKMVKGDVGIRYGLTFNGNVGQQIVLSGMISDRSEIGAIVGVGVATSSREESDSTTISTTAGSRRGIQKDIEKAGGVSVLINPFYAYHFPTQSNVDVYAGVNVGVGVGINNPEKDITKRITENYERVTTNTDRGPATMIVNGGVMLGCQYFFAKRAAFGAVAQLGLSMSSRKGKVKSTSEVVNTGSANNGQDSSNESFYNINNRSFGFGTTSYVGINLTFFFNKASK